MKTLPITRLVLGQTSDDWRTIHSTLKILRRYSFKLNLLQPFNTSTKQVKSDFTVNATQRAPSLAIRHKRKLARPLCFALAG